jgi:hypothetical protein
MCREAESKVTYYPITKYNNTVTERNHTNSSSVDLIGRPFHNPPSASFNSNKTAQ